ncbi:hypothetical protein ACTVH1_17330 [Gluconobacter cerinus]
MSTAVVAVYDGTVSVRCCRHTDETVLASQRLKCIIRVFGYKCLDVRNGTGGLAELLDHILTGCFGVTYSIIQYGILEAFTRVIVMVDLPGRLGFQEDLYFYVIIVGAGFVDLTNLDTITVSMGLHEGQKPFTQQVIKGAWLGRSFCSGHWNPVAWPKLVSK